MRILVVNPNTTASMTASIDHAARAVAAAGTEIVTANPDKGPVSIESQYDSAYCVPGMLELIRAGEEKGFDAYVVACFRDPGLEAAREIVSGPVLGIAEAAMHAASMVATGFTIISTLPRSIPVQYALARKYGFEHHLKKVRAAGVPVLELEDPRSGASDKVKREVEKAIAEEGAEAILLGCAGMVELARRLTDETGVPVLDGVTAAVKMAEALVGLGIRTSKAGAYAVPRAKPYSGIFAKAAPGTKPAKAAE